MLRCKIIIKSAVREAAMGKGLPAGGRRQAGNIDYRTEPSSCALLRSLGPPRIDHGARPAAGRAAAGHGRQGVRDGTDVVASAPVQSQMGGQEEAAWLRTCCYAWVYHRSAARWQRQEPEHG
jgi:hypothetical protein